MTTQFAHFVPVQGRRFARHLFSSLCFVLLSAPILGVAQERDTRGAEKSGVSENTGSGGQESLADRIRSVERKVFLKRRRFEVLPFVGMDLNDAFFQHFFVGVGAAYHLQDSFSLELRGGYALAELEKDSVRFVRVSTGSLLTEQALSLVGHGDINATWSPIYGKFSFIGEAIVHFDVFLSAGAGLFLTERGERASEGAPLEDVLSANPAVNIGIGPRFYINEWLVVRAELRNYTFVETSNQSDLQNITMFNLALSGFFPATFAYEYQ